MQLHHFEAPFPLTKSYERNADSTLSKESYPQAYEVTSHADNVSNITDFYACINKHAALGHCISKGELNRQLVKESRAGSTDRTAKTWWMCLDFDGLPTTYEDQLEDGTPVKLKVTPDLVMQRLGLGDISYVLQWSASYNIADPLLRFHAFIILSTPVPATILKEWLKERNHNTKLLSDNITLTKTHNALHWPLDVTTCQNDKLIYIAPPVLKKIPNPLGRQKRIQLIIKSKATYTFPTALPDIQKNKVATEAKISELRIASGLPARKFVTKVANGVEYLTKPGAAHITEMKQDRGFTYFNLNGGDSWGYYHPDDRPDYIYNFKDEPIYLTKELLPEYWADLCAQGTRKDASGSELFAFIDLSTSVYYRGSYNPQTDDLIIDAAKNDGMVRNFQKLHNLPADGPIPEWRVMFDPHDNARFDTVNKTLNLFQLTQYMRATVKRVARCPQTIFKVIHHALGLDTAITEHFINWLAFILQERTRTQTSWVLHGVEGTGKGILMNRIIRPIFGFSQTAVRRVEQLNELYNDYMARSLVVFVDEMEADALLNEKGAMAKIRGFITEPIVPVRRMFAMATDEPNYANFIFASNKARPVAIPPTDRRTNVAKYQPQRLRLSNLDLQAVEDELQEFHDYLMSFTVDHNAAGTPLETDDRATLISISETSIDTITTALLEGNMDYFIDLLPSSSNPSSMASQIKIDDYKHTLALLLARTHPATGSCNISRDELRVLFDYANGGMPESPNKFTSLLKHHRLHMTKVWVDKTVNGITVLWKTYKTFPKLLLELQPKKQVSTTKAR